ncbi:MAG TPA: hypothetical protein PKL96_01675 [Bacteroidales bacterium]|mgnify:FL=1|nr:hypothetical protein [Bacteroidales bacterium]HPS26233.1 hypothetical protein [Bacteroidales bacterium]
MKVSGFTFIKNAMIYDYPVVEAIRSVLPLCDEFVVAVGKSDDDTYQLINAIDKHKIKIIETVWDETMREGGRVLAQETNKAFTAIPGDSDWAFYIQGDEAVHEKYLDIIHQSMVKYKDKKEVDGLLFKYRHFYGSYDYVGASPKWYKHEIRIIKNDKSIYSFRDAQGFRKDNNQLLRVKPVDAYIYHYGWVKEPEAMQRKQENFNKYWHDDNWVERHIEKTEKFDYSKNPDFLVPFTETHPKVMEDRIKAKNWKFDYDQSFDHRSFKSRMKSMLEKHLGLDFSYKNYKII